MSRPKSKSPWAQYEGQVVVVDTDSHLLHIGTFVEATEEFIVIRDADVHDTRETTTSKEKYAMQAKRIGVRPNRKEARIRHALVVSVSLLADVVEY